VKRVLLSDVVHFVGGGTPRRDQPDYWDGPIPWVSCKDLTGKLHLNSAIESITEKGLRSSASNLIPSGSLLVATRMSLGKATINNVPVAINQDLKAAVCDSSLDVRYLLWFWLSQAGALNRLGSGATVKGVTLDQIGRITIPLPPLEEQKGIAAILDKADAIRRKREQAIHLANKFLRSLFLDMFGDPVRNPKDWPMVPISELGSIVSGSTPSREVPENFGGSIPWATTAEVNGSTISDTLEKVTEQGAKSARLKINPPGSILVAMYGQGMTRGRCALLGLPSTVNQACGVLLPSDHYEPAFMLAQLNLAYNQLRALGRGGNQPNLNLQILGSFMVILPPVVSQRKFAERVHAVNLSTNVMRSSLAKCGHLNVRLGSSYFGLA